MGFFRRKKTSTELLVEKIIDGEIARRTRESEVESKKLEFELKRIELEGAQLEARGEEMRKERADREKLRRERQEHAQYIREVRRQKRAQAGEPLRDREHCRVCKNPGDVSLTPDEIEAHYANNHQALPVWN